ncbi:hypothetical protein BUALT_Bualt16G0127800 [Buddleja alternifolia]|uniref:Calcium load-activated calcium channel n=1 Tax=Buddleja alternifolia TaxID=168488 RepID=A0AAV6WCP8_9LAMI|nr:hypothetical protein BUALT_Bualt16G0127800 [Buddleja alternifolia]
MASSALLSGVKYSDTLSVIGISICTAAVCETISWLLTYRTASYKSLKSTIHKASKALETIKSTNLNSASSNLLKKSSKSKKIDRFETALIQSNRDLSLLKFKSGAAVALVLFVVFGLLNSLFAGKVVAKIPFVPIPLVQKMSHRGLIGDDMTDCSLPFFYLLCSISIRTNLQKLLGFSPPRAAAAGAGFFNTPDSKSS